MCAWKFVFKILRDRSVGWLLVSIPEKEICLY